MYIYKTTNSIEHKILEQFGELTLLHYKWQTNYIVAARLHGVP